MSDTPIDETNYGPWWGSQRVHRTEAQLARLQSLLHRVVADAGSKPGKAILIRGRRRVGKSRLVEEFTERAGVPVVFFTASTRSAADELHLFCEEVASSEHPAAAIFRDVAPQT